MANSVIGPYLSENEDGTPETISGAFYRTMSENFLQPMEEQNPNLWFQQDEATAHTAGQTMDLLHEIFGERLISKYSDFPWPTPSPLFYGDIYKTKSMLINQRLLDS
ncbi:uncharacterized protein TNIN_379931 [Trichonephila inaurata madagascariensis]|uniref:Transposase n=1 Tax=Trichonephila inaurata madagascariensis TaxID=2747483 RepID=A0A8X7BMR6_9ARAC|nr:uncharacterized protein TNIN_379931 [Trichonephila inaurata madagascariensis]